MFWLFWVFFDIQEIVHLLLLNNLFFYNDLLHISSNMCFALFRYITKFRPLKRKMFNCSWMYTLTRSKFTSCFFKNNWTMYDETCKIIFFCRIANNFNFSTDMCCWQVATMHNTCRFSIIKLLHSALWTSGLLG